MLRAYPRDADSASESDVVKFGGREAAVRRKTRRGATGFARRAAGASRLVSKNGR